LTIKHLVIQCRRVRVGTASHAHTGYVSAQRVTLTLLGTLLFLNVCVCVCVCVCVFVGVCVCVCVGVCVCVCVTYIMDVVLPTWDVALHACVYR